MQLEVYRRGDFAREQGRRGAGGRRAILGGWMWAGRWTTKKTEAYFQYAAGFRGRSTQLPGKIARRTGTSTDNSGLSNSPGAIAPGTEG